MPCYIEMLDGLIHIPQGHCQARAEHKGTWDILGWERDGNVMGTLGPRDSCGTPMRC